MKQLNPKWKQILGTEIREAKSRVGMPLVEIFGDRRILIEHHQGVVQYGCKEIGVRVKFGILQISGSQLCLARMTNEQIVITGFVDSVILLKNGKEYSCERSDTV